MANRTFYPVQALDREVKWLFGEVTIGAAGAVTSETSHGFSTARTGTGLYTITLQDAYPELLASSAIVLKSSLANAFFELVSRDPATKSAVLRHVAVGVAADPASGDKFQVMLALKNSNTSP
jgi:hypothetical protein